MTNSARNVARKLVEKKKNAAGVELLRPKKYVLNVEKGLFLKSVQNAVRKLFLTFVNIVGHDATTGVDMTEKPLPSQTVDMVGFAKLLSSIKTKLGIEES